MAFCRHGSTEFQYVVNLFYWLREKRAPKCTSENSHLKYFFEELCKNIYRREASDDAAIYCCDLPRLQIDFSSHAQDQSVRVENTQFLVYMGLVWSYGYPVVV